MKLYNGRPREPIHISRAVNPYKVKKTLQQNWEIMLDELGIETTTELCREYDMCVQGIFAMVYYSTNWNTWKFHEKIAKKLGVSPDWILTHQKDEPIGHIMLDKRFKKKAASITLDEMKANVASHIVFLRQDLSMSQKQLCYMALDKEMVKTKRKNPGSVVSAWERGLWMPNIMVVMALAKAEGVMVEELLYTKVIMEGGHKRWAK